MKLSHLLLAALACATVAHARQPSPSPEPSKPPLPSGPLLGKAADLSTWVVTYTLPKSSADGQGNAASTGSEPKKPKAVPKVVTIAKSGQLRHITLVESDGRQSEIWCQGALQIIVRPEWKQPLVAEGSTGQEAGYSKNWLVDFPDFVWVSAKNYTGVQKVQGRDCLIFQDAVSIGQTVSAAPAKPGATPGPNNGTVSEGTADATACIDLETRLPVALRSSNETCTYEFSTLSAPLVLPADVQGVLDARAKRLQELTRKPPKPY